MSKKARVAIIGRANVGKSTLFNTLTSSKTALVAPIAGTTRDRREADCLWRGQYFTLIDTGGLDIDPRQAIDAKIAAQAQRAIADADLVLFTVDTRDGTMPADRDIAAFLRKVHKPILLIANKADKAKDVHVANEFYALGFGTPWPVSAVSGSGTGDLLDEVTSRIVLTDAEKEPPILIAIIGRPNVGKSSLMNSLLGEDRAIVSDEPYTTRDANDVPFTYHDRRFVLIDTAGVRRKARISKSSIEAVSVDQSLKALNRAHVVLLVTEADRSLTAQDRQLATLAHDAKASLIIVGNKWDNVPDKTAETAQKVEEYYRKQLNALYWAPILLMSASEKTKITKLMEAVTTVYEERSRKITDNALSKFLNSAIKRQKPTKGKGTRYPYIYRLTQEGINPPQFAVTIGEKQSLNYTYLNFLERALRTKFGFTGVPIKLWVEKTAERKP